MSEISLRIIDKRSPCHPKETIGGGSDITKTVSDQRKICSAYWDLIGAFLLTWWERKEQVSGKSIGTIMNGHSGTSHILRHITHTSSHKETANSCYRPRQHSQLDTKPEKCLRRSHVTKYTDSGDTPKSPCLFSCGQKPRRTNPTHPPSWHLRRSVNLPFLIYCTGLILLLLESVQANRLTPNRHRKRAMAHRPEMIDDDMPMFPNAGSNSGLYPSVVNLAATARIAANATCGEREPQHFCKLVEHVHRSFRRRIKRSQCDTCDRSRVNTRHDIEFAIDGTGYRWWQSPSINNGYDYHWVTISLDLKQVFQVAYFIMKAANSPRPGNWILEKSLDGFHWEPWQYFAMGDQECQRLSPGRRVSRSGMPRMRYDSEVVCTSYFSELLPLQNGEIHVSLVKGRPTAKNPSEELIRFTSARFIRLRFQRIRTLYADLMTFAKNPADLADPTVTKRYFYSIKDISIGGMCICHGHAHDCPSNPLDGKFVCKCEHNTMGDNCEQCLPLFNQHQWRPGNSGYQCEECNCHGHASSCYYDENVERRKESLNRRGMRIGGGVCVDCRDFTAGINCESCVDGYFRPAEVNPTDLYPCRRCSCNPIGTRTTESGSLMCRKSLDDGEESRLMHPGDCYCKDGYRGSKCDQCELGFSGFPNCKPCPCSADGSKNSDPCTGDCTCKENVMGVHCDQCKVGFYDLTRSSDRGCSECYCFGMSGNCVSANLFRNVVKTLEGWQLSDRYGAYKIQPLYDQTLEEPYVDHGNASFILRTGVYYWSAPEEYLGNRLSSYGGQLKYKVYYELPLLDSISVNFDDVDLILEGEDVVLELSRNREVTPFVSTSFEALLTEDGGWLDATTQLPATRNQLLEVLSNLHRLLIRAPYDHDRRAMFRIRDVEMETATPDGNGERVTSVEMCQCPRGYSGMSCEQCANGYYRHGNLCMECRCNGKAATCDVDTGVCENCGNSSKGRYCEMCLPGYFKDNVGDCHRCACPLTISSNNFSPTCVYDDLDNTAVCQNCPEGYRGVHCERCSDGYYGDPTAPGETCKKCECNGNSRHCDLRTGHCIGCDRNSFGRKCHHCAIGYFGDAINAKNCTRCVCDPDGSRYRNCHSVTGQCSCRSNIGGIRCDECPVNHFLDRSLKTCVSCDCSEVGSTGSGCGTSGDCSCKYGVTGAKCDRCKSGYYDFGRFGCQKCYCPHTNGNCDAITGVCVCPILTSGYQCSECVPNSYGWNSELGCKACECDANGAKALQCGLLTGSCQCKDEYEGQKCDQCRDGFYQFPACTPCTCHVAGTTSSTCADDNCSCKQDGQCTCKENAIGKKCDRCADNSFSMQSVNPKGCTQCFCFGVTRECTQAKFHWGDKVSFSATSRIAVANRFNTRSTTSGVLMSRMTASMDPAMVKRSLGHTLYYWRLPPQFNGDKLLSYGGKLVFVVYYVAKIDISPYAGSPTVVIRGVNNGTTIGYHLPEPRNGQSTSFSVTLRESGWTYLDSNLPVTRADFTMILFDIEYFMIKASFGSMIVQSRLSDVYLDVALAGSGGGRGDASSLSSGPLAYGIEECVCPPGYSGLSCQECARGFTRIRTGVYLGECRPCACNGKSDSCNAQTGKCLNCRDHFEGDRCDRCKSGYFLKSGFNGPSCEACACPLTSPENSFSTTCRAVGRDGNYICDNCIRGFEGPHCERCSYGYFGNPTVSGERCKKCGCNPAGSFDQNCNRLTGQCNCVPGVTGQICDQCRPKHAITEDGCIRCDDGCAGQLIEDVEMMVESVIAVKIENMHPPPWNKLLRLGNESSTLEVATDRAMTSLVDGITSVDLSLAGMRPITATIDGALFKSLSCGTNGTVPTDDRTQTAFLGKLKEAEKVYNDSDGLSTKMRRFVDRMNAGLDFDGSELPSRIIDLVSSLKSKKMSRYSAAVKKELRFSGKLFNRVKHHFTDPLKTIVKRYNRSRPTVSNATQLLQQKLENLRAKITQANDVAGNVEILNRMNSGTIRQLTAEIESLGNNISIVINSKNNSFRIVNDAKSALQQSTTVVSQVRDGAVILKNTLVELKRQSDEIAMVQVQLIDLEERTRRAQNMSEHIKSDALYYQRSADEMHVLSENMTVSALRLERTIRNIESAKLGADTAMKLLTEATLPKLTGNEYSDLLADVKSRKKQVQEKRRQIKLMTSQAKSKNAMIENFRGELSQIKQRLKNLDENVAQSTLDVTISAAKKANSITRKVMRRVDELRKNASALQEDVNMASNYREITKQISEDLKGVPITLNKTANKIDEVKRKQMQVKMKSDEVRVSIIELRRKIEESRMKAGSIRDAAVKSQGKCIMRYEPRVKPSRITEIELQVKPLTGNNTLFYMGRNEGDYILVYTQDGLVHVSWDLGSGQGNVVNPAKLVEIETVNEDWFQIEIVRNDQELSATVFKKSNKSATLQSVAGRSSGDSTVMNVNESDWLYVGGVPKYFQLPKDVPAHSYTGCYGDSKLQRKSIGLWNFREINNKTNCGRCSAPPTDENDRDLYGFNGKSYSLIRYLSQHRTMSKVTAIDLRFKTLSPNGVFLYKGSSVSNDFLLLELENGHIVARIDLGTGVHAMRSKRKYSNGEWTDLNFRRYAGRVRIIIGYMERSDTEFVDKMILGSDDHFDVATRDLICVGGCPTDRILSPSIQKTGFIGCMRGLKLWNREQPLSNSKNVLRSSQVEKGCPATVSRDVGIARGGFVEIPGHSLPVAGSVSITFNSREPDALLLLATDEAPSRRRRRRRHSGANFYSLSLSGGHIEARLRALSGKPLVLKSVLNIYSNGLEHTALLRREGGLIQLIVDDNVQGRVSGNLVKGDQLQLETSTIYVGGIPDSVRVKGMAGSVASLQGCVRELVTNGLVDFNNATNVAKSYVGSCAYTPTIPLLRPARTPVTHATIPSLTTTPITSTTVVSPSAARSSGSTITIESSPPTMNTAGCAAEGQLTTLRGSNTRFGLTANSHLQYTITDDVETRFRVQIEFRTLASHGLLLYAGSSSYSDFFSLQLRNGIPVFQFNCGKGSAESKGNTSLNDGRWHTIRLSRSKRKGYLKVDNMRYDMARSPRGANKMNIDKTLYVGGVPPEKARRLKGWWRSLDSCIRSVSVNKTRLDLRSPKVSNDVGLCNQNVEQGAYFNGEGFAVYHDEFRVGPTTAIELEFRTWTRDGALVSVSDNRRGDGLALELVNGSIFFRVDNGGGNVVAKFTPKVNTGLLCDGKWHKLKATKHNQLLTLIVDDQYSLSPDYDTDGQNSADTEHPLYIGGYPDNAHPQRQLSTTMKFRGCIKNMKLKGQSVDFSQVHYYEGIHPNSCPRSKGS